MKKNQLSLIGPKKHIRRDHIRFGGQNPLGSTIGLNNYFLERDGKPFFGIMGEIHFSRLSPDVWEDEILKMKAGGINIVSTYLFWIHHEEEEGVFRWDGCRNLRKFISLCGKHSLPMVLRVGPFCHGEAHNGGLPDWLFAYSFDVRSNDPEYLAIVERLYREISAQVAGLMFKDGGPIIAVQLENEYMHAGAPWEATVGTAGSWISAGRDGDAHMLELKRIAMNVGLDAPLYTATGWGGASAPEGEMLALWGGYAFRPWIFYGDVTEHPATEEYTFQDYHNDDTKSFNYEPTFSKEAWPYACCEMGGGMICFYPYRFTVPPESVDAMSVIKIAGGCNLIGYYMYHGGTNPVGAHGAFMNEYALPKRNYDYQAPIGEFGQVRESYRRLKRLHAFLKTCGTRLAPMRTVLPAGMDEIDPHDTETVRYAVRTAGGADAASGFLFLNNYQDHWEMKDHEDVRFEFEVPGADAGGSMTDIGSGCGSGSIHTLKIPESGGLTLKKDVSCILPFGFDMSGIRLRYATAQPITQMEVDGEDWWFWSVPEGMVPEYAVETAAGLVIHRPEPAAPGGYGDLLLRAVHPETGAERVVHVVTLTERQSLDLWEVVLAGRTRLLITDAAVLPAKENGHAAGVRLEQEGCAEFRFAMFPTDDADAGSWLERSGAVVCQSTPGSAFLCFKVGTSVEDRVRIDCTSPTQARMRIRLRPDAFEGCSRLLLRIRAEGDIGWLYRDGRLVHDCFLNGADWDYGLDEWRTTPDASEFHLRISPIKIGGRVTSDSPMAARAEVFDGEIAGIQSVTAVPVFSVALGG